MAADRPLSRLELAAASVAGDLGCWPGTSRARQNVRVSEDLFSTEVPGPPAALSRPPVMIGLEMHRLNGGALHAELPFPDEVSALVLKAMPPGPGSRTLMSPTSGGCACRESRPCL